MCVGGGGGRGAAGVHAHSEKCFGVKIIKRLRFVNNSGDGFVYWATDLNPAPSPSCEPLKLPMALVYDAKQQQDHY